MDNMQLFIENKIDKTLKYYFQKRKEISDFVNNHSDLTPDEIIESGEEMAKIEYKITALQIAKEN